MHKMHDLIYDNPKCIPLKVQYKDAFICVQLNVAHWLAFSNKGVPLEKHEKGIKSSKPQTKVGVGMEALWKAMTCDLKTIMPKVVPNLVRDVKLLEGEGGHGTIMLIKYGPDVPNRKYQKERVVEFDETQQQIGVEVIKGGHSEHGFASCKSSLQLSKIGETERQVNITVVYDTEKEDTAMPLDATKPSLIS